MKRELLTTSTIAPTTPTNTQDIGFSIIDELLAMLSDNESDITPENEAILSPFRSDGFVYTFASTDSTEEQIALDSDRDIWLVSYARFEDIGVLYHIQYKGNNYQVYFYHADKQYAGQYQNFKEYNVLRLGFKTTGEISVNGLDYTLLPTGVKENDTYIKILNAYAFIDADHYIAVKTTASEDDLRAFLKVLSYKKLTW